MWTGVHDEEWDGDLPLGADGTTSDVGSGEIVFSGDKLPWHVGKYEVCYRYFVVEGVLCTDGNLVLFRSSVIIMTASTMLWILQGQSSSLVSITSILAIRHSLIISLSL